MITPKERAFLKSKLNNMKPVLRIGKDGIKEDTIESIDLYLNKNELMKIQILSNSMYTTQELFDEIRESLEVEFVQQMGNILSIYRESDKHIYL